MVRGKPYSILLVTREAISLSAFADRSVDLDLLSPLHYRSNPHPRSVDIPRRNPHRHDPTSTGKPGKPRE